MMHLVKFINYDAWSEACKCTGFSADILPHVVLRHCGTERLLKLMSIDFLSALHT